MEVQGQLNVAPESLLNTSLPLVGTPVFARATPFQSSGELIYVPDGLNIQEIVEYLFPNPNIAITAHVYIGKDYIPEKVWIQVYPKPGTQISISIIPGDSGGDKNPLRTVLQIALIIAVIVVAPLLAPSIVSALGVSTAVATGLAGFAVGAVGSLLINAIAPPPTPRLGQTGSGSKRDSPTLFIEGARNQLNRFGVIPVVLGTHRMVPPLGAMNFTEASGNKQYVRQLFCWGYGDLILTDRKIGQTLISNFEDVDTDDILDGTSESSVLDLYSNDVFEEQLSITLTEAVGFQIRTTQVDADEIIIDLTFPQGVVGFSKEGKKKTRTVNLEIQTAPTGTGLWSAVIPVTVTAATTAAIRRSVRIKRSRAQYDVRIRRVTVDSTSARTFDKVFWTAIRTITNENPVDFSGISLTAIRIRATDQLNGAVDQYNAIVSNKIPTWTGATWTIGETSNPADIFRYVASNSSALPNGPNSEPLTDDRVDLNAIQNWHDYCVQEGFEYNAVIDFEASVREILQEVAAAGRASLTIKDGKWSVTVDKPQSIIAQFFTPRNTWSYSCTKDFITIPHAFRVLFINEEIGYIQDERLVFDDGFNENNATIIETLELPGITKPSLIYKHAREHIATLRLQPREHQFFVDVEHLIAPRGKRCKLAHDVINVGLNQGRIKEILVSGSDATHIVLDETVQMNLTNTYGVVIRTADNDEVFKEIVPDLAAGNTLEFVTPFDLVASGISIQNLVMFGISGQETIDIILKSVIPEGDFTARVTARDYNEAIFDASSGVIPPFDSGATFPPELEQPIPPVLDVVQSDEEVQIRNTDGSISSRMVISMRNFNVGAVEPSVTIQAVGSNEFQPAKVVSSTAEQIVLEDLEQGTRYDIRIRYKRIGSVSGLLNNLFSIPLEINNELFIGTSSPPPDITNFLISLTGQTALLTWDNADVIDFDKYILKYNTKITGANWNGSSLLADNIRVNTLITVAQEGTYLIKAVDRDGNESVNATLIVNTAQGEPFNAVLTLTEDPIFAGVKTNTFVNIGALQLVDRSIQGIYDFETTVDLGEVFTSRITPTLVAEGNSITNQMSNWTSLTAVSFLDATDPASWAAEIQVRTTEDDPFGVPVWTPFLPLVVGDYRFRGAQFQIVLDSNNDDVTPSIDELRVSIDMPDRVVRFEDEVIPVAGTTFVINPAFKQLLDVQVTGQDMAQGDYWTVTSKGPGGATVRFFDSSDVSKQIIADVQFGGFGRVQT